MKPTIAIAVIFGLIRIYIGIGAMQDGLFVDIYKAMAHVFVGGIGGAWINENWGIRPIYRESIYRDWMWWTFWSLTALEVVVAVASRIL